MTKEPDFVRANEKISDARNWRGDVNVTLGDETLTFKHRLLNEKEFLNIKKELDFSNAADEGGPGNVGQTDDQERLLELQQKEELSEEEEEELQKLAGKVAQQTDKIEDALGENGYDLFMEAGKKTIEPSEDAVEYVYDADPHEAKDLMGVDTLPNPMTKGVVREHLREQLRQMISEQPYPIKMNVGMQAFSETVSVLGNESRR